MALCSPACYAPHRSAQHDLANACCPCFDASSRSSARERTIACSKPATGSPRNECSPWQSASSLHRKCSIPIPTPVSPLIFEIRTGCANERPSGSMREYRVSGTAIANDRVFPFLLGFSVEANDHLLTRITPSRDRSIPDCAIYGCIFLRQDNFPATTSGIPGSTGHPEAHQF